MPAEPSDSAVSPAPDIFGGGRTRPAEALDVLVRGHVHLFSKVQARLYSNLLAIEIAAETAGASPIDPGIEVVVRRESSANLLDIANTLRHARGEDFLFLRGLERMRQCDPGHAYVARLPDGEIVASLFAHDRAARDRLERMTPGIYAPIAADEVLTEGVYCWPRFRRLGVPSHLLTTTLKLLADSGVARALAVIETSNVASLRAFARAGYVPTGVVRYGAYRLNRWRTTFVEDLPAAQRLWRDIVGSPHRC